MQLTANSILKVCLGVSAVVISLGIFNLTVSSAHAAPPTPSDFAQQGTSSIGKYQMTMSSVLVGDQAMWVVLVYNTETGQSKTYYDKQNTSFGPSFNISTSNPAGF